MYLVTDEFGIFLKITCLTETELRAFDRSQCDIIDITNPQHPKRMLADHSWCDIEAAK